MLTNLCNPRHTLISGVRVLQRNNLLNLACRGERAELRNFEPGMPSYSAVFLDEPFGRAYAVPTFFVHHTVECLTKDALGGAQKD
jgi:hypothetical protein